MKSKVLLTFLLLTTALTAQQKWDKFPTRGLEAQKFKATEMTVVTVTTDSLVTSLPDGELVKISIANLNLPGGVYDGSETKLSAGTNITISGSGTTADPYIINSAGGGTSDHGLLTGLTDDDHPQYLTQPEGDARYLQTYSETDPVFAASDAANTTGTNTGDQDISGIGTNASAISAIESEQSVQDAAIALNTAKVSYPGDASIQPDWSNIQNIPADIADGDDTGGAGSDGNISNVALSGTNLVFTGSNGGFNGPVSLAVLQDGFEANTDNQDLANVLSQGNEADNVFLNLSDNSNTRDAFYADDFIRFQQGSQLAGQSGTAITMGLDDTTGDIVFSTELAPGTSATLTEKFRILKANTGIDQIVAEFQGTVGIQPYGFSANYAAATNQLLQVNEDGSSVGANANAWAKKINFTGAGVTVSETVGTDDDSEYTINIPGGGGGSESTTVANTPEINLMLNLTEISATIVANSIDESKLDASVNATLNLADSALQAEIDGSITNELQTISINGNDLTLSDGGGTVTLPSSGGGLTTDNQNRILNANNVVRTDADALSDFTTTVAHQEVQSGVDIGSEVRMTYDAATTAVVTLANTNAAKIDRYHFDALNAGVNINFLSTNGFTADGFTGNSVLLDGIGGVDFEETGNNTGVFNILPGANVSYTTLDGVSPTVPTGLVADGSTETTATWDWNPSSDNIGVTGYTVSLNDGADIVLGNVLTYTATGLTGSTLYNLKTKAVDGSGNESAFTANVANTTAAGGGNPNLFAAGSASDPDNEANSLTGWTATGGSVSIATDATEFLSGSLSIAVTQNAAGVDGATEVSSAIISFPAGTYDFRISRKGSANFTGLRSSIIFADTFTPFAQSISAGTGAWQDLIHTETFAVTTNVRIYFRTSNGAGNDAYTNNGNTPQTAYFDFVFARLQ